MEDKNVTVSIQIAKDVLSLAIVCGSSVTEAEHNDRLSGLPESTLESPLESSAGSQRLHVACYRNSK